MTLTDEERAAMERLRKYKADDPPTDYSFEYEKGQGEYDNMRIADAMLRLFPADDE